ncbi:hypothetical protein LOZ53_001227 [Ophidiomyces ophidiicola]|nr:hypothetical protein LOZ55_004733 [Ophidiomyces ophidiicola]KAI1991770.1 hypothetical protein LOZ51_004359 [Ophidiomyces ophidiicola]KAI1995991.1 hypothetical protein LOZ53_001227 [Ophidiomyces ophidiicola]KAI1996206.1 hypothetical protein LOZ54_000289 [Ophidiomyces ophidiicola]
MEPQKQANRQQNQQLGPLLETRLRQSGSPVTETEDATVGDNTILTLYIRADMDQVWYWKSWLRKITAPPVTEVAKVAQETASATATTVPKRFQTHISSSRLARAYSIGLMKKGQASARSLPAEVTTTRIHISSTGSAPDSDRVEEHPLIVTSGNRKDGNKNEAFVTSIDVKKVKEVESENNPQSIDTTNEEPLTSGSIVEKQFQESNLDRSSGWFTWLLRNPDPADIDTNSGTAEQATLDVDHRPKPAPTEGNTIDQLDSSQGAIKADTGIINSPEGNIRPKKSWLYIWAGNPTTTEPEDSKATEQTEACEPDENNPILPRSQSSPNQDENIPPRANVSCDSASLENDAPKSMSWLFWSRENKDQEVVQINSRNSSGTALETTPSTPPHTLSPKNAGFEAAPPLPKPKAKKTAKTDSAQTVAEDLVSPELSSENPELKGAALAVKQSQLLPPNEVLPAFEHTFPLQERPGIFQQLGRLVYYGKTLDTSHVLRTPERPKIKKALSIGIHGYFPAPLIRNIIGQPTGTSVKFATMAEKAILQWASSNNLPCQVEKIALEGEGRISERVDLLWKLLLNWIDHIRTADFIMISCHSQGVPVATMLVAKLVSFGCVNATRIGICAMAGINLGPFPEYRSRWISGSAGELFDFTNPNSKVSQAYSMALEKVLDYGVRITYIGSIDDQLVSLEVCDLYTEVKFRNNKRNSLLLLLQFLILIFIAPYLLMVEFMPQVFGFSMKLRNLGVSDHGLIRELSSPLAGSLYTGEGHSRLYDDEAVYRLCIQFTLETTSIPDCMLKIHTPRTSSSANPYILPFAMRGVLEEEYVRRKLSVETAQLLKQFDDWKPSTKVLKDVKFRLEGIRSKL